MIRTLATLFLTLGLTAQAATHIAATATARDFLAGDPKGTSVTSEGKLTLGVPFGPRVWPENAADAVVFAAASDSSGRVFVATGGGLGRLFAAGPDGKVSLVFTAPEPNLTAVAVANDGTVVCASSPNGKVYRLDRKETDPTKSGTVWADPKEASIWALAFGPDGTLYMGTGNKGRIYKRGPTGSADLLFATEDTHVRTLLAGPDGTVYAGTSERGLVVAVAKDGTARTLHDFAKPEVIGLALRADGTLYAAATSAEPPPLATASVDPKLRAPTPAAPPKDEPPKGSVSITTSTSPVRPPPAPKDAREGSGEIVAIQKDGFVEPAWLFPDETLYAMRLDPKSDSLLVATGPRGRVYSWKDRRVRLEGGTDQKQVVAIPAIPGGFAAVTMNTPGAFFPSPKDSKGSYLSAVKDAGRLSAFGRLRWEGAIPAGSTAAFSVRSGNTDKPDGSWTAWKSVGSDGAATLPSNRYFQWQVELSRGAKGESPELERVELSYVERNAKPYLENLQVLEPGAVFNTGGASSTAVLSVTNPDENGIYAGLESPKETAGPGSPKKLYRKGFRTVTWKGVDLNADSLRYDVEGRREGASSWFPIRKDLDDPMLSFDTTALPDGRYRFRVTASDRVSNPDGHALTASDETPLAVVDNTAPVLKVESKRTDGSDVELKVSATDALSPASKAEGAVNADRWRLLVSDDGVTDSPREAFTLRVPRPPTGAVLSIRVVDASGNVAAVSVEYPFE